MPNRLLIPIVLLFCRALCFSQQGETVVLLDRANEILYNDPNQAIKIGENLIQNTDCSQKAETAMLLAKSYFVTGQYALAVSNVQLAVTDAQSAEPKIMFDAFILAAEIYNRLELFGISQKYLAGARDIAANDTALKKRLDAYTLFVAVPAPNHAACIACIKATPSDSRNNTFLSKGTPLQLTARAYQKDLLIDSAAVYFEKNAKDITDNHRGAYWQILALIDYSDFYFAQKNYAAAAGMLEQALKIENVIGNPYFLQIIGEKLSATSLVLGDKSRFEEFRKKAETAQNDVDAQITEATNLAFENLQQEKTAKIAQAKKSQSRVAIVLGIGVLLIISLWLAIRWFFATKMQHLQDIINYLKLIKNIEKKQEPVVKTTKNLSIPKETEELLLAKLEKFEAGKKYLTKDFSLAQLASMFDTNTKYLSEVINKYKRKNFNSYVNELRIRYIVEKLKNDQKYLTYKVSYLAEESGFSSHSLFSAAFKTHTGITPNVFIQFLSQDLRKAENEQMAQFNYHEN
jgi:AraC-like DNA-binding protein